MNYMNMVHSGIKMLILDNMAVNLLQEDHSPNQIMMAYCNHIISFLYFLFWNIFHTDSFTVRGWVISSTPSTEKVNQPHCCAIREVLLTKTNFTEISKFKKELEISQHI